MLLPSSTRGAWLARGLVSGRRRLELGQLQVAHVDDVIAELTVQQLELLAGHEDGRVAAARAGHHGSLLPRPGAGGPVWPQDRRRRPRRRGANGPVPEGRPARGRSGRRLAVGGLARGGPGPARPRAEDASGWHGGEHQLRVGWAGSRVTPALP